ncbi:MAG: hypothetical protein L0206_18185, partial [Actinobacteria bacterium]|nr:hypothetical protein [Actinomycetota bacterium]
MSLHHLPPRTVAQPREVRTGARVLFFLTAVLGLPNSGPAAEPPQGVQPLLRYTFDEEGNPALDDGTLGPSHNGSISGGSWQFETLGSGHALSLAESTSVTPLGATSVFDFTGSFSIHARARLESSGPGSDRVIVSKRMNSGRGYALSMDPGSGLAVFQLEGSNAVEVRSTWRIDDSALHDLLAVRNGGQLELYVDGTLNAAVAIPSDLGSTTNDKPFAIGYPSSGGGTGFRGVLDEVAVFDRAVTPADVVSGPDCNANGIEDSLEIASGDAADCNTDGVPDECQGGSAGGDCNGNGICDVQEIALGLVPDVNQNGLPDDCESWHVLPFECDSVVVLGDSLSDTGNFYAGSGHPPSPPYWEG